MRGTRQFFPPLLKSTMLRKRTVVTYLRVIDLVIVAPPSSRFVRCQQQFQSPQKDVQKHFRQGEEIVPDFCWLRCILMPSNCFDAHDLFNDIMNEDVYLTKKFFPFFFLLCNSDFVLSLVSQGEISQRSDLAEKELWRCWLTSGRTWCLIPLGLASQFYSSLRTSSHLWY